MVWVARLREGEKVEDDLRVLSDVDRAHDVIEGFARRCGLVVTATGLDAPADVTVDSGWNPETCRLMWFESPIGSARLDGPLQLG